MGFFAELKRRNVFRVAVFYAVSAWLLLQVGDVLAGLFGLPDWTLRMVGFLLLLGFPLVLILSWVYELTPEGVKREAEIDRAAPRINTVTGRKLDLATMGVGLVAIALVAWQQFGAPPQSATPQPVPEAAGATDADTLIAVDRSIAVLPFADLSAAGDQAYFADGITEEILNTLVRAGDLQVASRTSSFSFKGQEDLGIPVIARELDVRHVLEGSVRKAGDTIRITAQLIDGVNDKHLWSQTYDRQLTVKNLLAIQTEIASAIVRELGGTLGSSEPTAVDVDTANLDAYELYLEASARFNARGQANLEVAIEQLEQVTRLDPGFARAWGLLGAVYVAVPGWGMTDRDYYSLAESAARRAIDLNPSLALPYAALGLLYQSRPEASLVPFVDHLETAVVNDPHNATVFLWRGIMMSFLGYHQRAESDFRQCMALDPAYLNCRRWLVTALLERDKLDEAQSQYNEVLRKGFPEWNIVRAHSMLHGEHARLLALSNFVENFLGPQGRWAVAPLYSALYDPDYDRRAGLELFEARLESQFRGQPLLSDRLFINQYRFAFADYDRLRPMISAYYFNRQIPAAIRHRLLQRSQLPAYWRERGFPQQCQPVGETDFRCE